MTALPIQPARPYTCQFLRRGGALVALGVLLAFNAHPAPPASLPPPRLTHASQLARTYCQMCHVWPAPDVLNRATWEKSVLPQMMLWLGLRRPDPPPAPGTPSVYPSAPLLSAPDWLTISNYYIQSAPVAPLPPAPRPPLQEGLAQFEVVPAASRLPVPTTTLVKIDTAHRRILLGDAQSRVLYQLDSDGRIETRQPVSSAPVAAIRHGPDWFLATIGFVYPSDDTRAALSRVHLDPPAAASVSLLESLPRVTDFAIADLNNDGREDAVVCQFGNERGRLSWFENFGTPAAQEHVLHPKPGALRCFVRDFTGDGRPDLLVLWAQAEEGVYLWVNEGGGRFRRTALVQKHPAWGYSSMELCDWNNDGALDFITTNGDNGDHSPAPFKNYHGVRVYLNDGTNSFREAFFFPMNGAYQAKAADFDGDGDLDLAAISFFPDYAQSPGESFVYLENKGGFRFEARTFERNTRGRWMVMDAGDVDGDGDLDIVLGSFSQGPTTVPIPRDLQTQWSASGPSAVILKNTRIRLNAASSPGPPRPR